MFVIETCKLDFLLAEAADIRDMKSSLWTLKLKLKGIRFTSLSDFESRRSNTRSASSHVRSHLHPLASSYMSFTHVDIFNERSNDRRFYVATDVSLKLAINVGVVLRVIIPTRSTIAYPRYIVSYFVQLFVEGEFSRGRSRLYNAIE